MYPLLVIQWRAAAWAGRKAPFRFTARIRSQSSVPYSIAGLMIRTLAPWSSRARAMAMPMPLLDPVTTAADPYEPAGQLQIVT